MPTPAKGPRLWLRKRRGRPSVWIIRDGDYQEGTGFGRSDIAEAERVLADYIDRKHLKAAKKSAPRSADQIPIADVVAIYTDDVAPKHSRPHETAARLGRLLAFFGDKLLSDINGDLCRDYAANSSTDAMARRDLEDLRAAI